MNIVVTGATSFIGAPMVDKLIGMGHDVYAVVRPASKNIARLDTGRERLHVIEMNLEEADRLDGAILVPCEAFFHFGWDGAGSENRMNQDVQQKNAADSLKALEGARKLGCRTFLFSGSQAEYGIHREAMTEDTPLIPVSEYGKAKVDFGRQAMEAAGRWRQEGYDWHGDSCAERASDHSGTFMPEFSASMDREIIRGPWWKAVLRHFRQGDTFLLANARRCGIFCIWTTCWKRSPPFG